jgi:uncharacterized membrane protein
MAPAIFPASPATTATAGSGIVYTCDATINALSAGACNTLNTTIAGLYSSAFTNADASIYITLGNTGLGESQWRYSLVSYSSFRDALAAAATDANDNTAITVSAPPVNPYSSDMVGLVSPLQRALGLTPVFGVETDGITSCRLGTAACYDGVITVSNNQPLYFRTGSILDTQYDFFTVVEHETDEILGTASCAIGSGCINAVFPADYFRYHSDGTRSFAAGSNDSCSSSDSTNACFSIDGVRMLQQYDNLDNGLDAGDWITNCGNPLVQDGVGCPGVAGVDISATAEILVLDVVGYTLTSSLTSSITIETNPSGLQFSVDGGVGQTAPQTLSLSQGTHTIAVVTPQAGAAGTQYVFTGWSDSGAASHSIAVGSSAATYTASFKTQYQLTISASPVAGGTVSPTTGTFYNAGTVVPITAAANAGYAFSGWSGPVASANNASTTAAMSAALTVTANFSSLSPVLTIAKSHAGNFTQGQNGAAYSVTVSDTAGAGPTSGAVTVTETVPSGLTLVSMAGLGWTCTSNHCTRSDVLNPGASYPAIAVTVNVGAGASSPQVNSASVSGGGSASAGAMDSTVVQAVPAAVSVTPSSGSGAQQTFALQYADSLGVTDLTTVWVWFTSNFNTATSANSCLVYYARATNQLFLLNDAGTTYSSAAPGAAVTLSNSQCSMNAAAAIVTASGTNLIVNLPMTFMAAYAGAKSTYMYAAGSSANSGWQAMGTWTVTATVAAVSVVSVTPSSGSGAQQTFALQYADTLGATDLATVWVWFTSNFNTGSSANSCLVYYARGANQLFLLNDAGTAWSSPAAPGTAVTLSNSQCSINVAAASVTPSGTALTLNLPVTFKAAYAGAKSTYMYALGSTANSGWQAEGSWIVPGTVAAVSAVSVTPTGGSGAQQTFALQYADTLGATDLSAVWVWFTSNFNTVSSANSCIAYYASATNQILLINDAGTAYSSAMPGSAVTLSNSNCSINAAAASVTLSGVDMTVNLPMTFAAGFAGAKSVFMFALGSSANSGWQNMGTWTVPLSSAPAPVSVTPVSGAGLSQTFALLYADPLGSTDLTNLWVWFTSTFNTVSSANSCIAYYVRATNQINLINDAGTAILSSAAPGAAVTLSNSQCSINAAAATVTPSGNNLTVNLPVTFTAGYAGAKGIFMFASGSGANSGWQSMGTWTVP